MKIHLFKREDGTAIPAYDSDRELWNKIKIGEHIFSSSRAVNPRFRRLAFGVARCALENFPEGTFWADAWRDNRNHAPYLFIKALELEIGFADPYQRPDGTVGMVPRSIAWENMTDEEFEPILEMLIRVAAKYIHISYEEFARNYENYL